MHNWGCIVYISKERQVKNYNKAHACPEGWQNRLVANQKLFALYHWGAKVPSKSVLHLSFMLIRSIMASSSNGIFSTLLVQWAEQHLKQLARLMPPPAWRGKGHLRDKAAAVPSPLTLPYTQTSYLAFVPDLFLQRNHPASQWIYAPWFYLLCLFRFLIATMED